jgi:hypothetical protein
VGSGGLLLLLGCAAEEEDEVATVKGESLDVAYEVGGWLQVRHTAYAATLGGTCHFVTGCW